MNEPPVETHREPFEGVSGHPPRHCRRFNLGDAMILVAASALGLALARMYLPRFFPSFGGVAFGQLIGSTPWSATLSRSDVLVTILVMVLGASILFTLCGTLAFLIVRLRRPRPPLRDVALQPGVVACWAILIAFCVEQVAPSLLVYPVAIPLAWAALAMSGRWRPEPGWIDRLGRLLGICWIATGLLATVLIHWVL